MRLSINLCTRKRPHVLASTLDATLKNIASPHTILMVSADEDDDESCRMAMRFLPHVHVSIKTRDASLGEKYNRVLTEAPADVYLAMVDYAPHVTSGFDQKILDAASIYPDGYAIIYNRPANLSFPGINAVTAKMATAMGGIYPAYYPYWFVDHHLDDIGQMTGRIVFADVAIDTSERKESAAKVWTQGQRDTWFWALLFDSLSQERQTTALRIIDAMEEMLARKEALRNNIPMIVHHSMMVNSQARQMVGSERSTDPWYENVKARAMAKLRSVVSADTMSSVEQAFIEIERQLAQKAA